MRLQLAVGNQPLFCFLVCEDEMNKLTLTLPAALLACVMLIAASQFAEAGHRGGGGRGGGGRGFHGGGVVKGPIIKGQGLAVPGGVRNLGGPIKGQALSVPGGVVNLGPARRRRSGLGLGVGFGSGYGYGYGFGFAPWLYESGHIPVPPYFALHPPVYYSQPVPRTYGYSPFAYESDVKTPDAVDAMPAAVITNPYIDQNNLKESKDSKDADDVVSTVTPQEILNPYVDVNEDADELPVAITDDDQDDSKEQPNVSDDETTEVTPQAIRNPYVEQDTEA